jgi:hypothetical protein
MTQAIAADPHALELAHDYFAIGNGIVAFHVGQTILFLNAIHKEGVLKDALIHNHALFTRIAWRIAVPYVFVIVSCAAMEFYLRHSSHELTPVLITTVAAAIGRLIVVWMLTFSCTKVMALVNA